MNERSSAPKKTRYHHGALREALLEAAEHELAEKGVEGFSLRAVAKRAGVSHAAPAHHFKDGAGLLTQLAIVGYRRFLATQERFQRRAQPDPTCQLVASGLAYVDFATQYTALFRLIFASDRPDRRNPELTAYADAAFEKLVVDVAQVVGRDPKEDPGAMRDVMAAWVIAHGIADLTLTGRFERVPSFAELPPSQRDEVFSELIRRAITPAR